MFGLEKFSLSRFALTGFDDFASNASKS